MKAYMVISAILIWHQLVYFRTWYLLGIIELIAEIVFTFLSIILNLIKIFGLCIYLCILLMFFVVLTGYYMIFIFIDPVGAKNTLIKLYRNIQSMIRERLSEEEK